MSHFTKIKTLFKDVEFIKKALSDLGFRYEHTPNGKVNITGFGGAQEQVELAVRTGTKYDVGFRKGADQYDVIADWWGVERLTQLKQDSFVAKLSQRYAYHKTLHELEENDFYVDNEVTEDEVIVLTVKW